VTLLNDFKAFILRGNVVDLAVAVVVGAAFKSIVDALVADLITPFIAAVGGEPDFSALDITVNGSHILYGHFINQIVPPVIMPPSCSSSSSRRRITRFTVAEAAGDPTRRIARSA
jgi:large conductance mechanosensitive channel protein